MEAFYIYKKNPSAKLLTTIFIKCFLIMVVVAGALKASLLISKQNTQEYQNHNYTLT